MWDVDFTRVSFVSPCYRLGLQTPLVWAGLILQSAEIKWDGAQ